MWRKLVLSIGILGCVAANAHEIGTTRVSASFRDSRTYQVEVVTDATALAEKLETWAGKRSPKSETDATRLRTTITELEKQFRQRVTISFDGTPVTPAVSYSVEPAIDATSAAAATIRFTGEIPANAKQFTWNYGWTFATYSLVIQSGENSTTQWLEGGDSSAPYVLAAPPTPASRLAIARQYLVLGFTHIVPYGLDHMLFVLGIYLLSRRAKSVLLQVSAFTIAHSITLGLSMYGLISVSPRIVEPAIALSIAYVAIENLFLSELKSWRLALVFAFGLLHGMGFAGALQELGLPRSEFVTALVTFNLGVEAGQLSVIGAAFLFVGWRFSSRDWYRGRVVVPASLAIACTAIYWTVERLFT